MRINIIENSEVTETEITIECCKADDKILQLLNLIKKYECSDRRIIGISNGETYCIDKKDILYFESVDRKTFCYTSDGIYEISMKLYEIEEQFENDDYIRISKSAIVNLNKIKSIRPDFGSKILATMENGEKIYISRQYVPVLKKKLGIGDK
ncbi:MAG: LytTR family transcriptional regulator DNA-binding domain-containing protein [Eubacterium sp.]|nr:LytTR family transcriptional regulator DNA-binding domain-containing protein [Eubacterium sp.]MDE6767604.1 LytTR family transcriptional regulator DNA-binding domain-containing protein [Eubacterium sp.]